MATTSTRSDVPSISRVGSVAVKNAMHTGPATCEVEEALDVPARLMWALDIGCVPVVGPDGTLAGMITDRDIAMCSLLTGRPLSSVSVSEAMSHPAISIGLDEPVSLAEELMRKHRIRRLPVVDDQGRLVGIFALNDLARLTRNTPGANSVESRQVLETLEVIGRPRRNLDANA